jgi:hypothetical protein
MSTYPSFLKKKKKKVALEKILFAGGGGIVYDPLFTLTIFSN